MDSSDGERSKSSDVESPQNSLKHEGHSFSARDDDRPGRVLLRPWLESMLESSTIEGLQWIDKEKTMFKVPWKHRSKKDWSTRHSSVFLEWAKNTGRWNKGDPTPNYAQLKTRLRCAFNKAPDIEEMKGYHSSQGEEPYKVYRFRNKKECLAQKLKALSAKHISKGYLTGTPSNISNHGNLWEIKKERCEEEMVALGTEMYLSDGAQETHILSFKDNIGEIKDCFQDEIGNVDQNDVDQVVEQKFFPAVIPLTVEMFSSSMSDESDVENEGSRRPRSNRSRNYTARSQKQQDASIDLQNVNHTPQKQHEFEVGQGVTNGNDSDLTGVPTKVNGGATNEVSELEGKTDLDFLRVASLFVEAGKILQKTKEPISAEVIDGETRQCIKQEILDNANSEDGVGTHCEENNSSNGVESSREVHGIKVVHSSNSFVVGSTSIKVSTIPNMTTLSYPSRLPKLVPLSSLKNFSMLNSDSKGTSNSAKLSQLPKIRMVNANILHQISKSPVRFSPSPGLQTLSSVGSTLGIPRSESTNAATHLQPRLVFFSSNSFLPNFPAPAISRPTNPETVKIVLSKLQSSDNTSVAKDSGIDCQSLPSLIMLSSAAEVAESNRLMLTSSQETLQSDETNQSAQNVPIKENGSASISPNMSTIITATPTMPSCSIPPLSNNAVSAKLGNQPIETQEEALDLSNSAVVMVQKEQEQPIFKELCGKLEIVEAMLMPKKEISKGSLITTEDGSVDITGRLNDLGMITKEIEELADPKLLKNINRVIDLIKLCSSELHQWQKSLISQKDVIHWRTKLVESEEEKIQLKAKYLGVSLGGELQGVLKQSEIPNSTFSNNSFVTPNQDLLSVPKSFLEESKYNVRDPSNATMQPPSFVLNDKALDLVKGHNSVLMNKTTIPISTLAPQKNIISFGGTSGSIKVTTIPPTSNVSAKSPKNLRVINLNKPPEPLGVVYPMPQDRSKTQQQGSLIPTFTSSSAVKFSVGGNSRSCLDSTGVSPSQSPSTSPFVLGIQHPFKVVKINRTPSTEGCTSGLWQLGNGPLPVITSDASAKTGADDELKCEETALRDVVTGKKKIDAELSNGIPHAAKRFKSMEVYKGLHSVGASPMDDQTSRDYDNFKNKWYSIKNQSLEDGSL